MDWKKAKILDGGAIQVPERWLHLYYYEALNILFRFENSLRVFVYIVLKMELKGKWKETAIKEGSTIGSETKKRLSQAKDHGYLGYEVTSPMLYLNSGELIDIIVSEAYWKHFACYFKASKSILTTKLQEIGTVRNSLAHFRPIKEDDLDLIKQNTKQVMLEVEKCLVQVTSISNVVPTNSTETWYKKIKSLGGENVVIGLFLSGDENWLRLSIEFKVPTLEKTQIQKEYYSYKIGNIQSIKILQSFKNIKEACIYLSERPVYGTLDGEYNINAKKEVSIVFSKQTLVKELDGIVDSLTSLVLKIDEEVELLMQDSLAKGEFVETKPATAAVRDAHDGKRYWYASVSSLNSPTSEISEVEFWGSQSNYSMDFVSATSQYPWMPSSISQDEIPF